jgi:uncharacterized protein YcbX
MPRLAHIQIFPIKSLDPVVVEQAKVLRSGALQFDRRWAIVDAAGKWINGKRTPRVHGIRTTFDEHIEHVSLACDGREATFHLTNDIESLEEWLGEVFCQPVRVLENLQGGFPDDTDAPGPTVLSSATLQTVAGWFPQMTLDEARRRFRANLEIDEVESFWEDRLFGPAGSEVVFRVGDVEFAGTNPCQRCPVPTRDPSTGEVMPRFTADFARQREATLPNWAERSRFNHYYRLAVNTHSIGKGGTIRVGDPVLLATDAA